MKIKLILIGLVIIFSCNDDSSIRTYRLPKNVNQNLANSQKVTAEPTIFQGNVYFPIYQPNADNPCSVGAAFICSADDECGTNNSDQIGKGSGNPAEFGDSKCHFAGFGILSEIVVFAGKLFANIAGLSEGKSTLVVKVAAPGEVDSYRRSWKENF